MAQVEHPPLEQEPLEWDAPLYRQAVAQYENALEYSDIADRIARRLAVPERAVMISLPVCLDGGRWEVFAAYRVQHSSVLGPTKGGIRYDSMCRSASARRSRCG